MPPKRKNVSDQNQEEIVLPRPKMPPKRKNVADQNQEAVSKKTKKEKRTVEASSRSLRPRKAPEPNDSTVKSIKKTKKKAESNTKNEKNSSPVKQPVKRRAKGAKQSDTEESPAKQSKGNEVEDESDSGEPINATSIYDFTAKDIKGQSVSLKKYKGHVCIIVNVASKCGHTAANYKEFVEIFDKYNKDKGLRILAFPCNQFGKQEPGDNEKICEFAEKRNVKFDMFEKIEVNGKNAHPLWKYLTSQKEGPKGSKIDWNFTKFLINKEGRVVDRFKSAVKPSALVKELEKLW